MENKKEKYKDSIKEKELFKFVSSSTTGQFHPELKLLKKDENEKSEKLATKPTKGSSISTSKENLREAYLEQTFNKRKIRDFCKNYRLEDEIKEDIFNQKFNSERLEHVFFKKNDYTGLLNKSIETRIKNQSNIIIIIYGEPHTGKSVVAQLNSFKIIETFKKYTNLNPEIRLCFSDPEFSDVIKSLKLGDVIIRDESPKTTGIGSRTIENNLNNIVEIVRVNQNCFIFVSPKRVEASVVTYYLEMAGKKAVYNCCECGEKHVNPDRTKLICKKCKSELKLNYKESSCRCLLYDPNFNDGKIPLGRVFFELHDDQVFREKYLEKKLANIKGAIASSGQYSRTIDKSSYDKDLQILLEECKKYKIRSKIDIRSQIDIYNKQFDPVLESEKMIKGDSSYMTTLITELKQYLTGKKKLKPIDATFSDEDLNKFFNDLQSVPYPIEYKDADVYKKMPKNKKEKYLRNFEIYKKRQNGKTGVELSLEYNLKPNTISSIYWRTLGSFSSTKGHLFEKDFKGDLENSKLFGKVILDGTSGAPDIVCQNDESMRLHVFSLKCLQFKNNSIKILKEELKPEREYIRENLFYFEKHDIFMHVIVLNNQTNEVYVIPYDYKEGKNVIIN